MFDRICTSDAPQFRSEPNAFLVRVCAGRLPGRALDIAMGQGRNAVHLARSGWQVTGFDVSAAGLAVAEQAAAAADTRIEAVLCASDEFDDGTAAWDLMVASYAVVPITSPEFARAVTEALRPGGLFVVESFAADGGRARRPVDIDPDALREAYGGLRTVADEVGETVADWMLKSETVVRFAAERSAA